MTITPNITLTVTLCAKVVLSSLLFWSKSQIFTSQDCWPNFMRCFAEKFFDFYDSISKVVSLSQKLYCSVLVNSRNRFEHHSFHQFSYCASQKTKTKYWNKYITAFLILYRKLRIFQIPSFTQYIEVKKKEKTINLPVIWHPFPGTVL